MIVGPLAANRAAGAIQWDLMSPNQKSRAAKGSTAARTIMGPSHFTPRYTADRASTGGSAANANAWPKSEIKSVSASRPTERRSVAHLESELL